MELGAVPLLAETLTANVKPGQKSRVPAGIVPALHRLVSDYPIFAG